MANNYTKTMRQALQEARDYRDTTEGGPGSGPQKGGKKFSSSEIKKAYGILNDPRYKQGNYSGAAKAINKLAPGLADHPDVKNALKRANEEVKLTEKKAEYLSLQMSRPGDAKRVERWLYKNMSQVNTPYDGPFLSDMNVEFENVDDADDLMANLKRAGFSFKVDTREELDLPATGDTTTSNASQEVEQVEDLKEYTGMSISKSVNSNDVATALKNLKKGTKLYVQGKSQGGMRTMGDVISVSGDTVKIKPTASNGPTSVKVKDITMMDTLKEESINEFKLKDSDIEKLKKGVKQGKPIKVFKLGKPQKVKAVGEAKFTPAQVSALQKAYGQIGPGGEKNAMRMNQLAKMMGKYSKDHLSQLADMDIPMVSRVAKELMK